MIDLTAVPADRRLEERGVSFATDCGRHFRLDTGPLAGYRLLRLAPDDYILGLSIHHVVADGWSLLIAMREIAETYDAPRRVARRRCYRTASTISTTRPGKKQQLQSGRMRPQIDYWKRELAGAPTLLELPTDRPRPATPSAQGRRVRLDLDVALLEPLKQVGRRHDSTLFTVLLAAFQVMLHRYSGQDDIMVGSTDGKSEFAGTGNDRRLLREQSHAARARRGTRHSAIPRSDRSTRSSVHSSMVMCRSTSSSTPFATIESVPRRRSSR